MTPTRRSRCRSHRVTLDAVLDGRDRLAALQQLELHAKDCADCARALEESRALRAALDALPGPEFDRSSDDAFVAGVLGRIGGAHAAPRVRTSRPFLRRFGVITLAAAAAAAALIFVDRPAAVEDVVTAGPLEVNGAAEIAAVPKIAGLAETGTEEHLPPVIRSASSATPIDELIAVLDVAMSERSFDPRVSTSAGSFLHEVRAEVDGDLAAAARSIIRAAGRAVDADELQRAALAARLLGVTADYRDRELLAGAVDFIGAPAAFALADRGGPGFERLWEIAAQDDRSAGIARATLRELVLAGDPSRDPSRGVPRAMPVGLVAPIVSASPESGASLSLGRYLATGDEVWLATLLGHERRDEAIAELFSAGVRRRDRARALQLVERAGAAGATDFVGLCLEIGEPGAVDALAAIPGDGPLELMVEFARSGGLVDAAEERAWRALVAADAARIAAISERWSREPERVDDVGIVLEALVRANVDARSLLVRLAALDVVGGRARVTALLHIAATDSAEVELEDDEFERLRSLQGSEDADVAAAAWMVHGLDPAVRHSAPPAVQAALERDGDPAVRLVRVSRALTRERARDARRSRRAGARP